MRQHARVDQESFDGTIGAIEAIVDDCRARDDRAGYFAAMYLAVTRTMRRRAESGHFTDAERMERFVCRFAARYLDAYGAWRSGSPVTGCWSLAFETSSRSRPVILQHLLLGMNAHINLDLGVAAASIAEPGALDAVRVDFDAVNDVLGELVDGCQGAVGEVSPWLGLCDRIGGTTDETIIHFSLVAARRQAWAAAVRLEPLDGAARDRAVADLDRVAVAIGRQVVEPGLWATALLLAVRARERADVGSVIERLAAVQA
jgi:hypothetical protein